MLASTTSGVLSSDHWDATVAVADTAALRETSAAIAVADSGVAGGRGQRKFESSRIQKEKSIRWNG